MQEVQNAMINLAIVQNWQKDAASIEKLVVEDSCRMFVVLLVSILTKLTQNAEMKAMPVSITTLTVQNWQKWSFNARENKSHRDVVNLARKLNHLERTELTAKQDVLIQILNVEI